jgi:hypothetical protein
MRKSSITQTVILGAVGSLLATAATLFVQALWGERIGKSGVTIIGTLLVFAVVVPLAMSAVGKYHANVRAEVQRELLQKSGLVRIFDNFDEAQAEILDQLSHSKAIRVFIQFGRAVLSDASVGTSNFYDYLSDARLEREADVKILHAGADNPYLTERAALTRGSHYIDWKTDLEHAEQKCQSLATKLSGSRVTFSSRGHKEGFLWRLFLVDDVAYMQPYLHIRKNASRAPVFKFRRTIPGDESQALNENSLYKVFSDFFDFKWEENRPEEAELAELTRGSGTSAVAAVTRFRQTYAFIVPRRYVERSDREVPFHGIGGKKQEGETWVGALEREAKEEIGASISIQSSARTRYLTTGAELESISLRDVPRPYCVYKRIRESDPNFAHPDILWLVGYEATLMAHDFVGPKSEAAAVVYITADMLFRAMVETVTYREIKKAPGCHLIVADGVDLGLGRRAVPSGIAAIIAAAERPKVLKRL